MRKPSASGFVIGSVFAAAGLGACAATAGDEISRNAWRIEMVAGAGTIDTGKTSFEISAEGAISTTIGCNRIGGHAKIQGNSIAIGPLIVTRMACAPPLMVQEQQYTDALQTAASFAIEDGLLKLKNAAGNVIVTFARAG